MMMKYRGWVRDDSGIAMVVVIGTLAFVTVLAITAFSLSRQSLHESGMVKANSQAFQLADAGLEVALAHVQANGFIPGAYPITGQLDGVGSWEVTVTPEMDSQYLAISRGKDQLTGAVETVKTKFFYLNIWEMNIAGDQDSLTAGGGGITGTSNVTGPFYVVGPIEMSGTAYIHDGPFFVRGGDIILKGTATIGQPTKPINVYVSGSYPTTNFYAASVSHAVPSIVLPRIDGQFLSSKWQVAKAESVDNYQGTFTLGADDKPNLEANGGDPATYTNYLLDDGTYLTRNTAAGASGHYKYIGPMAGPSAVGNGLTNLTIGGATPFGAWGGVGGTYPDIAERWDDFAWDPATRTLYIEGTVFVDGDVTFIGGVNDPIKYKGNGTIIANGDITIDTGLIPAESESVPANMPLDFDRALGLVTPENIIITISNNNTDPINPPNIAGALYAGKSIEFQQNLLFKGSVIAGSIKFGHPNVHLVTDPRLPSFLPDGMPGKNMSLLTRGTWAR